MKQEEVNLAYLPGNNNNYNCLAKELNSLQLQALCKVCPNRFCLVSFHPDQCKSLDVVDKQGQGSHARNLPVLPTQAHPRHPHLLITSSHDCTIQELNFERQQSTEIVNFQALSPADTILFSAFDLSNHGRKLWASDTAGGLVHCNLRQPNSSACCWTASKKKISCLTIYTHSGDRLAVTARLNQEMW
ncbi:hypothetical protein PtA15_3A428 [Puccinia triticina]|uniref:DNA damage-binding protein CMR1 n=1 Tax=Puccinia triticina TaxID=208348 RepID=A0ABY7CCW7_9BASI|nr:uncharacterized protein PtA15_3A428 [Puccinia triticina]WAQ83061.1 hypothetical protein PtA15_3A428 [Puccinia triticina]WAR53896.1 hypothetical protein PtB15_3B405 [Puccinia triticina]